jgi:hypothetical protein
MKSRIVRHIARATLFAAALLATGWFAQPANAQEWTGKFTLPYEARWGQAVLPPGDYQLTVAPGDTAGMLIIREARSLRAVALEPVNIRENSREETSTLLIGTQGKQHIVYSLTIAELGASFVYQSRPAHNREFEEARKTQTVPVTVAKK